MSDDGDIALGGAADRAAVLDEKIAGVVLELSDTFGYPTRQIYDALIRAARLLRAGRDLSEFR